MSLQYTTFYELGHQIHNLTVAAQCQKNPQKREKKLLDAQRILESMQVKLDGLKETRSEGS